MNEPDWREEDDSIQQLALIDSDRQYDELQRRRNMFKARQKSSGEFLNVAEGTHPGVVYLLADLGKQQTKFGVSYQLAFGVQFPTQLSKNGEPLTIIKTVACSVHKKSTWRKILKAIFKKDFPDQDAADNFDNVNVLKRSALWEVSHTTKEDKTYANITGAVALPDGMEKPVLKGETVYYGPGISDIEASKAYERLPEFLRTKISNQLPEDEEDSTESSEVATESTSTDDDIPF